MKSMKPALLLPIKMMAGSTNIYFGMAKCSLVMQTLLIKVVSWFIKTAWWFFFKSIYP